MDVSRNSSTTTHTQNDSNGRRSPSGWTKSKLHIPPEIIDKIVRYIFCEELNLSYEVLDARHLQSRYTGRKKTASDVDVDDESRCEKPSSSSLQMPVIDRRLKCLTGSLAGVLPVLGGGARQHTSLPPIAHTSRVLRSAYLRLPFVPALQTTANDLHQLSRNVKSECTSRALTLDNVLAFSDMSGMLSFFLLPQHDRPCTQHIKHISIVVSGEFDLRPRTSRLDLGPSINYKAFQLLLRARQNELFPALQSLEVAFLRARTQHGVDSAGMFDLLRHRELKVISVPQVFRRVIDQRLRRAIVQRLKWSLNKAWYPVGGEVVEHESGRVIQDPYWWLKQVKSPTRGQAPTADDVVKWLAGRYAFKYDLGEIQKRKESRWRLSFGRDTPLLHS